MITRQAEAAQEDTTSKRESRSRQEITQSPLAEAARLKQHKELAETTGAIQAQEHWEQQQAAEAAEVTSLEVRATTMEQLEDQVVAVRK